MSNDPLPFTSLLPANASQLEQDLERAVEHATAIPVPLRTLWDPMQCPYSLLPWLAWACSVDEWDDQWSEQTKRQMIADAFMVHCYKGTPFALQKALDSLGLTTGIREWWQQQPQGQPGTITVTALLNDNLDEHGQGLLTQTLLHNALRLIRASKRGTVHFDIELGVNTQSALGIAGAYQMTSASDQNVTGLMFSPDDARLNIAVAGGVQAIQRMDFAFKSRGVSE